MPSNRRLITRTGAAFVGAAVTALLATPAMACTATLTGTPTCDTETGQVKVTWTITNDYSTKLTLKDVTSSPTLTKIVNDAKVPKREDGKNGVLSETVSVEPGTVVSLGFTAKWPNGQSQTVPAKTVNTTGICKEVPPPTKSATPSAQPSASGGAGGGPVSPSTSAAAPALPVTGSQTGLYAGGAVVLLGAGAGLFVVARRRRVKFEA